MNREVPEHVPAYTRKENRSMLNRYLIITTIAFSFCTARAAEDVLKLVKKGNDAFRDGKYSQALKSYEKADEAEPGNPVVLFDKGAALYRQEVFGKAREHFEQAAARAEDKSMTAECRNNIGNCVYRQTVAEKDTKKKLEGLEKAANHYRHARDLGSGEASHNLAVTRGEMKELIEELKRQKQKQQNQDKNKDNKKDEDKKKQQENQEQEQNKDKKEQQDKQEQEQNQNKDQKNQEQEQLQQEQKPNQNKDDKDKKEEKKQQAKQKTDQDKRQQQREKEQQQNPQQQQQQKGDEQKEKGNIQAKAILKEEKDNKERRRIRLLGGHEPVKKDW